MVVCNCSAVVETLFESELFGHVKGAFTGADSTKMGLFEYAHGGTLFLDEIGDMPLATQAKLLRVLQNQEVQRVGSLSARKVDVRVVAATNHDLRAQIAEKRFREDLYYRLSMVEIKTPALADRKEDLPLLERFFIRKFAGSIQEAGGVADPARPDSAGAPLLARQRARVGECHRARLHAGGRRSHRHRRSPAIHAAGRRLRGRPLPAHCRRRSPPGWKAACRSTSRNAASSRRPSTARAATRCRPRGFWASLATSCATKSRSTICGRTASSAGKLPSSFCTVPVPGVAQTMACPNCGKPQAERGWSGSGDPLAGVDARPTLTDLHASSRLAKRLMDSSTGKCRCLKSA